MAELQTISACLGLVQLAIRSVGLIQDIREAPDSFKRLSSRIDDLRNVIRYVAYWLFQHRQSAELDPLFLVLIRDLLWRSSRELAEIEDQVRSLFNRENVVSKVRDGARYAGLVNNIASREACIRSNVQMALGLIASLGTTGQQAHHHLTRLQDSVGLAHPDAGQANLVQQGEGPPDLRPLLEQLRQMGIQIAEPSPDPHVTDGDDGRAYSAPALVIAVRENRADTVEMLLKKDSAAIHHKRESDKGTLFHEAVDKESGRVLEVLVEFAQRNKHGSLIDQADEYGRTPLMKAVSKVGQNEKHLNIAKILIRNTQDINRINPHARGPPEKTALCICVFLVQSPNALQVYRLLLAYHADPSSAPKEQSRKYQAALPYLPRDPLARRSSEPAPTSDPEQLSACARRHSTPTVPSASWLKRFRIRGRSAKLLAAARTGCV